MLANYCTALADETKKKLCEKKKQQSITISPHKLCNTISYVKGSLVFCRFFFSPLFCIRDEDENLDEDGLDCIGLEEVAKMRTRLRKSRRSRLETAKKTIAHSTHTHTHTRAIHKYKRMQSVGVSQLHFGPQHSIVYFVVRFVFTSLFRSRYLLLVFPFNM